MRTHALALAFVLPIFLTLACGPEPADTVAVSPEPESAEVPAEGVRTASTSIGSDAWQVDADRLERERNDPAWRAAAEADRRHRGAARSATSGAPFTPRTSADRSGAAGRSGPAAAAQSGQSGQSGQGEGAGASGETGDGDGAANAQGKQAKSAQGGSSSAAPVVRLRQGGNAGSASSSKNQDGQGSASSSGGTESWQDISPSAFDGRPILPVPTDGGGPSVLRAQWLLDRAGFSPGVIDGRWGKNTEKAIYWLQDALGLDTTGKLDAALYDRLAGVVGADRPVREVTLSAADLEGPFVKLPEEVAKKADLDCLCYESAEEMLAERYHTTPGLLAQLNPKVDFAALSQGTKLWVPNVEVVKQDNGVADDVERIVISKSGFYLQGLDADGEVLYHFPSTLGADYDPSPTGNFKVTGVAYDPDFHYQPKLFADVPDTEKDYFLPPGANSPVGLVWMQLSKENYGIHGTSAPETIGYTSSHGCVRLTNWDAIFLANHVVAGVPVEFRE